MSKKDIPVKEASLVAPFFWSLVDIRSPGECWVWKYSKNPENYTLAVLGPWSCPAHRVAFIISTEKSIPSGLFVCHHCDNPICVNPYHLFLGTNRDNRLDYVRKQNPQRNKIANISAKAVRETLKSKFEKMVIRLRDHPIQCEVCGTDLLVTRYLKLVCLNYQKHKKLLKEMGKLLKKL